MSMSKALDRFATFVDGLPSTKPHAVGTDAEVLKPTSKPKVAPADAVNLEKADAVGEPSAVDAEALLGQFRFRLSPGASPQAALPPIIAAIAEAFGGLEALTFRILPIRTEPSSVRPEENCEQHVPGERVPEDRSNQNTFDPQEVTEQLCRLLDAQDDGQRAHAAEAGRTNRSAQTPTTHPPQDLVPGLAAALAAPRPWQCAVDRDRARGYFEARTRRMLAAAGDPFALIEREERAAECWGLPP
jgi:hypothetical protein